MEFKLKVGVVFLITIASLFAEELNLDIETAREIALQRNPSLKLAREAVLKSRASVNEVRGRCCLPLVLSPNLSMPGKLVECQHRKSSKI